MPRKSKRKDLWSPEAVKVLFDGIGISGVRWFTRRCNKSAKAVYNKARRMYGPGGLTRGAYTLWELAQMTGYDRGQIKRAQSALNQKWKRLGPVGAHLITEEQSEEIVSWLRHDFWSKAKRLYSCLWCTTSTRPHFRCGLCQRCYYKHFRICRSLGIPSALSDQLGMLREIQCLACPDSEPRAKFVEEGIERLENGLAFQEAQLERFASVVEA